MPEHLVLHVEPDGKLFVSTQDSRFTLFELQPTNHIEHPEQLLRAILGAYNATLQPTPPSEVERLRNALAAIAGGAYPDPRMMRGRARDALGLRALP